MVADAVDNLASWLQGHTASRTRGGPVQPAPTATLRFASYGRVATRDNQDVQSSRQWQYQNAERVIADTGPIARSFFDAGYSRTLPWTDRPQAQAVLADPGVTSTRSSSANTNAASPATNSLS